MDTVEEGFLNMLARNEDDETTRMIYAEYLDDQNRHEEADRQRKWPAAKAWLVNLCDNHMPDDDETMPIDYPELMQMAKVAASANDFNIHCGNNMDLMDALYEHKRTFRTNFQIVTGISLPEDFLERSSFFCAC